MDGVLQILVLLAFLGGGALFARTSLVPRAAIIDSAVRCVLWILLLGMGFRIGNTPSLFTNLGSMGALAFATALLSVTGSCAAVYLASFFVKGLRRADSVRQDGKATKGASEKRAAASTKTGPASFIRHLRAPLTLISVVVLGVLVGILIPPQPLDMGAVTGWTLNILLFLIGIQFVQSGTSLRKVLASPVAIAVPLATIFGTLAASLALIPLFDITPGKAMALAGGFGWYSLSGVLIGNLGDPALGSVAFLANMLRESLALIMIPFLGRSSVPAMAVSVGGATSMDVTLPLIEQTVGPWIVPISFMSGAVLSLTVPFLVPVLFRLG